MARRGKAKKVSAREERELENYKLVRRLLEDLGWKVNLASTLGGRGGHCVVHGQRRVILKSQCPTADKVDVLVDALSRENLAGVEVPAAVQALIDAVPLPDDADEAADQPRNDVATDAA
jgi:hypothetical protein